MTDTEGKLTEQNSRADACSTIDEFESRFFPEWYEKQKSTLSITEKDAFGESLARFSAVKHLNNHLSDA
jgi:hypothetical protein